MGFESSVGKQGRPRLEHSFLNFYGLNEIEGIENQILVLLLISWFIAGQYGFYRDFLLQQGLVDSHQISLAVISDKLSGDNDQRSKAERSLQNLVDPDGEQIPISLARSARSDDFFGDLLADNVAGWLNAVMSAPAGEYARFVTEQSNTGVWDGWRVLAQSDDFLKSVPALSLL